MITKDTNNIEMHSLKYFKNTPHPQNNKNKKESLSDALLMIQMVPYDESTGSHAGAIDPCETTDSNSHVAFTTSGY